MLRHRSDIIVFTKFGRRVERPDSRSWCAEVTWLTFVFEKAARMPLNTWAKEITAILGICSKAETRKRQKSWKSKFFSSSTLNSHDYRRILSILKWIFFYKSQCFSSRLSGKIDDLPGGTFPVYLRRGLVSLIIYGSHFPFIPTYSHYIWLPIKYIKLHAFQLNFVRNHGALKLLGMRIQRYSPFS